MKPATSILGGGGGGARGLGDRGPMNINSYGSLINELGCFGTEL